MIMKSLKNCGISNSMNGTEDEDDKALKQNDQYVNDVCDDILTTNHGITRLLDEDISDKKLEG